MGLFFLLRDPKIILLGVVLATLGLLSNERAPQRVGELAGTMAAVGTAALGGSFGAMGMAAAAIGGFVGSAVGQLAGKAMGVVDEFSWKDAAEMKLSVESDAFVMPSRTFSSVVFNINARSCQGHILEGKSLVASDDSPTIGNQPTSVVDHSACFVAQ